MGIYHVVMAIARGARWDTGQQVELDVLAPSKLDAALRAESLADQGLGETEYTHAVSVRRRTSGAAMALAA